MSTQTVELSSMVGPASAARVLGVTARRVVQLERAGRLTATRTDLGRLFRLADIEALAAQRRDAGK